MNRAEKNRPAYAELADTLRKQILSGQLSPGDRLPIEPEMSAQHGVSKSTTREALRVLGSEHLVTTVRGVAGGTFVAEPHPDRLSAAFEAGLSFITMAEGFSIDQLLEIREILEVPAARLAAARHTPEQLDELRATLEVPRKDQDYTRNRTFHDVLCHITGNPLLPVVARPVFHVVNERFRREAASKTFWTRVECAHEEILDAIAQRDEDRAAKLMYEHLEELRPTYKRIMSPPGQ
ncbi:FadR/GntR family transcriptional regulator [Rhodococcus globerulus]|uniref:FadR/GntR family transcriptional regulator n=1 Tax=Rhodococcus globerulus TaxID=33008 RepID=UPI003016F1AE